MSAEPSVQPLPDDFQDAEEAGDGAARSAIAWRRAATHAMCRCCSYEPPRESPVPSRCPKCFSGCWDRFVWRDKPPSPQPEASRAKRVARPQRTKQLRMPDPATATSA